MPNEKRMVGARMAGAGMAGAGATTTLLAGAGPKSNENPTDAAGGKNAGATGVGGSLARE